MKRQICKSQKYSKILLPFQNKSNDCSENAKETPFMWYEI